MSVLRVIAGGRAGAVDPGSPSPSPDAQEGDGVGREHAPLRGPGLLRELFEQHGPAIFARCRYLLKDDEAAKDGLQDTFVKALRSLDEFRGQASLSTWLLRLATNHCLNVLRERKTGWRERFAELQAVRRNETETPDRRELLRALLSAAEPEAQEVAVMTYVDEMTQAEIGAALGRSLPTVRKRLREFLAAARAALREACPDIALPEAEEGLP
jgi:RNA polymerase sigma-70 factor, ECF subfamily